MDYQFLVEHWRHFSSNKTSPEQELREWLESNSYLIEFSADHLLQENMGMRIWQGIRQKLHDAKEWSYQQYVKLVKPLLQRLVSYVGKLKDGGFLKKYNARKILHGVQLFGTKKYIKIGAVFLLAIANLLVGELLNLPKKIQMLMTVMTLATEGKLAAAAEALDLPLTEVLKLVGNLRNFKQDFDKTTMPGDDKLGVGDFEFAEE